jgi:F-type H+-transporting ATPase subunit delta
MEELAQVYARSLFEVAREQGKLDVLREQLAQLADALRENKDLEVFFFSPYFSTKEKQEALGELLDGADEVLLNFLNLLIENHRMPVIFHIRRQYERRWDEENKTLPVEITSAIELDSAMTESLGKTIGERAGRKVQLAARVDPDILGGIVIRVGNSILDASIRSRLEQLRRQVARGVA